MLIKGREGLLMEGVECGNAESANKLLFIRFSTLRKNHIFLPLCPTIGQKENKRSHRTKNNEFMNNLQSFPTPLFTYHRYLHLIFTIEFILRPIYSNFSWTRRKFDDYFKIKTSKYENIWKNMKIHEKQQRKYNKHCHRCTDTTTHTRK